MTHHHYDVDHLISLIQYFQDTYSLKVILEPGEAVVYQAAYLMTTVLDVIENPKGIDRVIIDSSATAHMPDVLEMPYRPMIVDSQPENEAPYSYQIGGVSCLSGDIIGNYAFERPLHVGDQLVFQDMAQYTMVKTTHFNGIPLPDIYIGKQDGSFLNVNSSSYTQFKERL